ncbi:hypothetical protein SASPL_151686 [Salvia splendens]|uniref:Protein kinase domain-containing protein n=1 Tax=Salvia splendens TaxID=180675 RepID=A0A8X8W9Q5_SALSN|nr:hypothetical protein SASPL_151686 [Salvia splendens]
MFGVDIACRWGGLVALSVVIVLRIWSNRSSKNDLEASGDSSKLNSSDDQNLYFLSSSSRSKEPLSINIAMFEQPLLKLTLVDILEATNNFCKSNIIGDGGLGTVYKATLPGEDSRVAEKPDRNGFSPVLDWTKRFKIALGAARPDFKDIEGGNLVGWVFLKVKNRQAVEVLDPAVLDANSKQMMLRTLNIAVKCLSENPPNRPTMLHVLKSLKGIREE